MPFCHFHIPNMTHWKPKMKSLSLGYCKFHWLLVRLRDTFFLGYLEIRNLFVMAFLLKLHAFLDNSSMIEKSSFKNSTHNLVTLFGFITFHMFDLAVWNYFHKISHQNNRFKFYLENLINNNIFYGGGDLLQ